MSYLDYLRPKWKHSKWEIRCEAVREITSYTRLQKIANEDQDEHVREEARKRLQDPVLREDVAREKRVRILAVCTLLACAVISRPWFLPRNVPGSPSDYPRTSPSLAFVDTIVNELALGNVAFNAPSVLRFGERTIIQVLLSRQFSIVELQNRIRAKGEKEGHTIRVSNHMEARLWGQGFHILAILPEDQAIGTLEPTEWKWEIEPMKAGEQILQLTLSAVLYLDDQPTPYVIRTFERRIDVRVVWSRWVASFVGTNWQWLGTSLLIPLVLWGIHKWEKKRKRRRRRRTAGARGAASSPA